MPNLPWQVFFYLSLHGTDVGRQIISDQNDVFRLMETYFEQPLETKMKDCRGFSTHGQETRQNLNHAVNVNMRY
jgi:hypothetical protein